MADRICSDLTVVGGEEFDMKPFRLYCKPVHSIASVRSGCMIRCLARSQLRAMVFIENEVNSVFKDSNRSLLFLDEQKAAMSYPILKDPFARTLGLLAHIA